MSNLIEIRCIVKDMEHVDIGIDIIFQFFCKIFDTEYGPVADFCRHGNKY
jgi:hypothetical protein